MPRKLKKINSTTYEADFERARVEVGDIDREEFIPCCKMYNFEDETSLKVTYADRPYSLVTPEAEEVDKIVLTEAVHYPPYEIDKNYKVGDLLEYNGGLYEVIQNHKSQEDWPPPEVPALYKVSTPQGVIAEWVQPLGAHDAYAINTKVSHNGKIWVTIIDANVWEPGVYGWEETDGRVDVECYCVDGIGEQNVSGFEFEIILRERPASNVVEMAIEAEGLKFYYQPELTQEEIDEGAYRPEEVVGSYAVYHATCGQMHKKEDAEKYQTGKAFHIYRPKVYDANGNWIWGELNIDAEAGILSITVDQQWLNNAVYPVRVDPTFGYTEVGGASLSAIHPRIDGFTAHLPEERVFGAMYFYVAFHADTDNVCGILYGEEGFGLADYTIERNDLPELADPDWHRFGMVKYFAVTPGDYILCLAGGQGGNRRYYDDSLNNVWFAWEDYSYVYPPIDPESDAVLTLSSNKRIYSFYAETASIPVPILTAVQENSNIRVSWTYE